MSSSDVPIPEKLKHDAILEAICEVRFDMETIPEVFFGRLADNPPWKSFRQRRLPTYDIPAAMRQADPNLWYQPVFELVEVGGTRSVRIGQQVLSYHQAAPYVGWQRFQPELDALVDCLFTRAEGVTIRRLGLRYINALKTDLHDITSITNLDMEVVVAGDPVTDNANVNFASILSDDTQCMVRVSTPGLVIGTVPVNTSILIDVDVFTKEGFDTKDDKVVKEWIESAHQKEKKQFFRLLTNQTIGNLREA